LISELVGRLCRSSFPTASIKEGFTYAEAFRLAELPRLPSQAEYLTIGHLEKSKKTIDYGMIPAIIG
jgi:hypothetical protein